MRTRQRLVFLSVAAVAVAVCLLGVSFAGSSPSRPTRLGPVLGADYPNYYIAGQALNDGRAGDLYNDTAEVQAYHRLFPDRPPTDQLPFLYPPWVAQAFRPLALLPYRASFAVFLVLALGLYLLALSLLRPLAPSMSDADWRLFLLLAVAFEPFLFECWMGGQLSVLGLLAVCLAIRLEHDHRPFCAGLALGLLAYKPTLLLFLGPMMVAGRRWRTVGGLAVTGAASFGVSAALTGWSPVGAYAGRLLAFGNTSLVIPLWKYVDLRSMLESLVGRGSPVATALALAAVAVAAITLSRAWSSRPTVGSPAGALTWAATVTVTLFANLYVPAYDLTLMVPALLLTWLALDDDRRVPFVRLAAGVAVAAWVTQPLARATGVQLETFVLAALAVVQLKMLRSGADESQLVPPIGR